MGGDKCGLILALDIQDESGAWAMLEQMEGLCSHIKVSPRLYASGGMAFLKKVMDLGYRVFLDIKLHDIPNTVASAVEYLAGTGLWALTLHTAGGEAMLDAAREARNRCGSDLKLLGVSVLTSLAGKEWEDVHPGCCLTTALKARAHIAGKSGMDGLVCSPLDLEELRGIAPELCRVVPGIRSGGVSAEDQKRVATASYAAQNGAGYIVVGRPILKSPDPRGVVRDILKELSGHAS